MKCVRRDFVKDNSFFHLLLMCTRCIKLMSFYIYIWYQKSCVFHYVCIIFFVFFCCLYFRPLPFVILWHVTHISMYIQYVNIVFLMKKIMYTGLYDWLLVINEIYFVGILIHFFIFQILYKWISFFVNDNVQIGKRCCHRRSNYI